MSSQTDTLREANAGPIRTDNNTSELHVLGANELFTSIDIGCDGSVLWGTLLPEDRSGVYVVTIPDPSAIVNLPEKEQARWTGEQEIVYIGRARCLSQRLRQFYRHRYGDRAPHRGGRAILLLPGIKTVYWAVSEYYAGMEHRLITAFELKIGAKPFGNRMRSA